MMIEADVLFGHVTGGEVHAGVRPIMAHPPAKHSDLTLERFLDRILQSDLAKGIKLDFKEMDVVEPALVIIQSRRVRPPPPPPPPPRRRPFRCHDRSVAPRCSPTCRCGSTPTSSPDR